MKKLNIDEIENLLQNKENLKDVNGKYDIDKLAEIANNLSGIQRKHFKETIKKLEKLEADK